MAHAHLYVVFVLALGACTGGIGPSGDSHAQLEGAAGASGGAASRDGHDGQSGGDGAPARDMGHVGGLRRLNNLEYDQTMRDLLGVPATPASTFIADEKAHGFDTIAEAFGMTEAQYEQYWSAADALVDAAFADPTLRARIVTCQPARASDTACTERILRAFAARAWRRPLEAEELERLEQLASDARALGETHDGAIAHAAKALLSSVPFLYRLELDPDPSSTEPHPLDPYELASRLSYLVWSSMPDAALFEAARDGSLLEDGPLRAQLARMLDSERSRAFIESFGGQWLGLRDLGSHQVDTGVFPEWNDALRAAMIEEGYSFFGELLRGELPMTEFFTADFHYASAPLAALYGLDGARGDRAIRLTAPGDERRGFLGLAAFLTRTSFSYRTAPTLRGKWILENLLCQEITPPPANVPELDDETEPGVDPLTLNVRERLARHREDPECASCHVVLDPMGLGLERFDAIGRYRDAYAGGGAIDATGELPSGETFDGLLELSAILARDPRLLSCATEKLMTYALSRALTDADAPYVDAIRAAFVADGASLRTLLEQIVLSEPFRRRRGEGDAEAAL